MYSFDRWADQLTEATCTCWRLDEVHVQDPKVGLILSTTLHNDYEHEPFQAYIGLPRHVLVGDLIEEMNLR